METVDSKVFLTHILFVDNKTAQKPDGNMAIVISTLSQEILQEFV